MLNLEDKEWKDFKIDILFKVNKGIYLKQDLIIKGDIPYITAKAVSNGLSEFIGNKKLFKKNSITVEKVKLTAFYQPIDYYCSHDVSVLENKVLNKENSLFISSMINRQGSKYSYGRQAQMNVVKRETLFCPINKNKEPDFKYMEEYSKSIINNKTEKYKQYAQKVLNSIEYKNIETLENKDWKEFFLIDIFTTIQRGKRLTKQNQIKGNIPYISSTSLNNGVDNFIGNKTDVRIFSDCLTIANSGSVGASFYQPYSFVGSDHITHLKKENMNKYVYMFISTLTNRFSEKYNFNREINDKRISREKIMLPVNEKKEPDFEYMEQYMKNLTYKKIKQYLDYLKKQ
ncbi:Restriction enzyme BgcI subunit beta [Aliarcobacter thereius]|uniref:Restriction enzyme BgcI subunit beta n=2 Tax=Aliarcobacter thereius TaxID=544718 RepID=A0A1C0B7U0_9BACT|nr:Restriction enzyme BgcI subunit beta [Aliarcobacter thereius]